MVEEALAKGTATRIELQLYLLQNNFIESYIWHNFHWGQCLLIATALSY
jgi:hypothetical protein